MAEQSCYVPCKVSLGYFNTEFIVTIGDCSVFVNRSNVRVEMVPEKDSEVAGKVLAYIVREEQDRNFIELAAIYAAGNCGLRTYVPKSDCFLKMTVS